VDVGRTLRPTLPQAGGAEPEADRTKEAPGRGASSRSDGRRRYFFFARLPLVFLRADVLLRADVVFRAVVLLRAVDLRAVVFLAAVVFFRVVAALRAAVERFAVVFLRVVAALRAAVERFAVVFLRAEAALRAAVERFAAVVLRVVAALRAAVDLFFAAVPLFLIELPALRVEVERVDRAAVDLVAPDLVPFLFAAIRFLLWGNSVDRRPTSARDRSVRAIVSARSDSLLLRDAFDQLTCLRGRRMLCDVSLGNDADDASVFLAHG
jgi:hypothetical protein